MLPVSSSLVVQQMRIKSVGDLCYAMNYPNADGERSCWDSSQSALVVGRVERYNGKVGAFHFFSVDGGCGRTCR